MILHINTKLNKNKPYLIIFIMGGNMIRRHMCMWTRVQEWACEVSLHAKQPHNMESLDPNK